PSPGVRGSGVRFSSKEYLRANSDPSLQLRGNTTISLWVKFATMNTNSGIRGAHAMLGKWSANINLQDYVIAYHYERPLPNRFEFMVSEADSNKSKTVTSSLTNAEVNRWYLVVCQYDADRGMIGISIDGGDFATTNVGPLRTSDSPLFFGADHGPPWNNL